MLKEHLVLAQTLCPRCSHIILAHFFEHRRSIESNIVTESDCDPNNNRHRQVLPTPSPIVLKPRNWKQAPLVSHVVLTEQNVSQHGKTHSEDTENNDDF